MVKLAQDRLPSRVDECVSFLAIAYLGASRIQDARALNPKSASAIVHLKLHEGKYSEAAKLAKSCYETSWGHERSVAANLLLRALIKDNQLQEASSLALPAVAEAQERGYACCLIGLLDRQTQLHLKLGDVPAARALQTMQAKLTKQGQLTYTEPTLLLLAEGRSDEVFRSLGVNQSDGKHISGRSHKIFDLLILARAWASKQNMVQARNYLSQAQAKMKETGDLEHKDLLEEVELALNAN